MANYATLKAAIAAAIKQNGINEITGNLLQQQLLAIVNSFGVGYQYAGIATPETNPGTPDQNVFYFASTAGIYVNLGGIVLADGEIALLKYNGAWSKDSTGAASLEKLNQLGQEVDNIGKELENQPKRYEFVSVQDAGVQFSDGAIEINNSLRVSDYIAVNEGDHIVFYGACASSLYANLAAFTSEKSYIKDNSIQGFGNELNVVYLVPSGVSYIRFTQNANYLSGVYYTISSLPKICKDVVSLRTDVDALLDKPVKYDFEPIFNGYVNYSDGTVTRNINYLLSDYIPVNEGDTIFAKHFGASSAMAVISAFDSAKNYQSSNSVVGDANPNDYNYIVPVGVKYIRFTQHMGYIATSYYTIYHELQFYKDISSLKDEKADTVSSVNLYDKNNGLDGYFLNYGGWTASAQYGLTNPIKVSSGVTYKTIRPDGMGTTVRCAKVDENGDYVAAYDMTEADGYLTYTPNFDGYMRFNVGYLSGKDSFMVCKSSEYPNFYVPYATFLSDTLVKASDIFGGIDNPLYGKILACDGDSICYGQGYVGGYAQIIAARNGMAFQNLGVSGGTLASNTYSGETPRHWISTNVSNLRSDADYIILEGGVNDSESMGTMSPTDFTGPFDSTTFNGAIDTLCQSLLARFPGKKIGFIVVHAVYNQWMPGGAKYEAVKAGFKKWGIPICDLIEQCPPFALLPADDYIRLHYTKDGDGWHPNEDGYKKYYCDKIEAWMRTL